MSVRAYAPAASMSRGAALGLVLTAPVVVWMAIGKHHSAGDGYVVGPYHLNLALELGAGVLALVVFTLSIVAAVRGRRIVQDVSGEATALACLATCLCSAAWRVATNLGSGQNIGTGAFIFLSPVISAAMLIGAVADQQAFRRISPWRALPCYLAAAGVAPALLWLEDIVIG